MKVTNFKLINEGYNGVEIKGIEYIRKGDVTIPDNVRRIRPVTLDSESRKAVQGLKYYFLNLTGHWIAPYSKYYDIHSGELSPVDPSVPIPSGQALLQTLWNQTQITAVKLSEGGFSISGSIETVPDKLMNLTTPFISADDDIGFYLEAREKIDECIDLIMGYFKRNVLMPFEQPKEFLQKYMAKDDVERLSMQEMTDMVIDKLTSQGAIIMMSDMSDDDMPVALGEKGMGENVSIHKSGSVDDIPVSEEVEKKEKIEVSDIVDGDKPVGLFFDGETQEVKDDSVWGDESVDEAVIDNPDDPPMWGGGDDDDIPDPEMYNTPLADLEYSQNHAFPVDEDDKME